MAQIEDHPSIQNDSLHMRICSYVPLFSSVGGNSHDNVAMRSSGEIDLAGPKVDRQELVAQEIQT